MLNSKFGRKALNGVADMAKGAAGKLKPDFSPALEEKNAQATRKTNNNSHA